MPADPISGSRARDISRQIWPRKILSLGYRGLLADGLIMGIQVLNRARNFHRLSAILPLPTVKLWKPSSSTSLAHVLGTGSVEDTS